MREIGLSLYRLWMRLGLALGRITTPILMGLVFFLVITPAALVLRLVGRDPMSRRREPERESYRIPVPKPPRQHIERPF